MVSVFTLCAEPANGTICEGKWEQGATYKFKGRVTTGTLELEGEFENDQLCRGRTLDRTSGIVQEGEWRDGFLVSGLVRHADGRVEEGEFHRGKAVRTTVRFPTGA